MPGLFLVFYLKGRGDVGDGRGFIGTDVLFKVFADAE